MKSSKSNKRRKRKLMFPETGSKQAFKRAVLKGLPDRQKSLVTVTTTSRTGKKRTQTFTFVHDLDDDLFIYRPRRLDYKITFKLETNVP